MLKEALQFCLTLLPCVDLMALFFNCILSVAIACVW